MRYVVWAAIVAVLIIGALFLALKERERTDAAQDVVAEADRPLADTVWVWSELHTEDGEMVVPQRAASFSVTFDAETVQGTTDCNSFSGSYSIQGDTLAFGPFASTKMYCEGAQEALFVSALHAAERYHINAFGQLVLTDERGGTVVLDRLGS